MKKSHLYSNLHYSGEIEIEKISQNLKDNILNNLREKLSAQFLDEGVCIACDRITLCSCMTTKSWSSVHDDICYNKLNYSYNTKQDSESSDNSDDTANSDSDINKDNTIYYAMKKTLIIPPGEHLPPVINCRL